MKIKEELIITGMTLDGYEVPIPEGFSELMNRSGAWEYIEPDESSDSGYLKNYDRRVAREDGRLRTYLTYKNPLSSRQNKRIS